MNYLRKWWEHYRNTRTVVVDTPQANLFPWPENTSTTSFRIQSGEASEWDSDENIVPYYDETTPFTPPSGFWSYSGNESLEIGATSGDALTIVSTGYSPYFSSGNTVPQHNMVMDFRGDYVNNPLAIYNADGNYEVYLRPEIDIHIADNVADDIEIDLPNGWTTISSPGKIILTKLYDEDENAS